MTAPLPPRLKDLEQAASEAAHRLPALLAEAKTLSSTLITGSHGRRRAGSGETFWQYRDYTINDSAASIDWRQSARSPRRLYVRETEWETAATVRFWCQGGQGFDYTSHGPTKRWRSLVLSTALAFSLSRAGENVGALPYNGPARRGSTGVMHLAETLFHQTADDALPPPPTSATQAVYISDFYLPTEQLVAQIGALATTGIPAHFVEVTDPAEDDFPFEGHTLFQTPGDDQHQFRFGQAQDIRDDYKAIRSAHRSALRDACRHYGVTYIAHRTDHPPGNALSALHHAVGKAGSL